MYRTALRSAARPAWRSVRSSNISPRRFASTSSPAGGSRSWKSSALRWGLVVGAVYYYNTSPVFAEEPSAQAVAPAAFDESDLPTVNAVIEKKRQEISSRLEKPFESKPAEPTKSDAESKTQAPTTAALEGSPEELEEEAGQEGAFNPETGEINWDCPCLGGMAHGPCGEEFKTAFSCFVYSEEEPKGMDCIDKFQAMQDCFRQHPDIYGSELADEEDAEGELAEGAAPASSNELPPTEHQQIRAEAPALEAKSDKPETADLPTTRPSEDDIPTHDATAANVEVSKEEKKESKPSQE